MKALVYTAPQLQTYQDVADPRPAEGEALIKVAHTGICGSDMHAFLGQDERRPAPLILGHEVAGTVISGTFSGHRVTINPLVTCGKCEACRSARDNLCSDRQIISLPPRAGGFADYLAMPESNLVTVPNHITDAQAALAEPLSCGWHAVRLARNALRIDPVEAKALVIGGGAIGLSAVLSLKAQGITDVRLTEPNTERARYLETHCGIHVLSAGALETSGFYDLIIDGVGYSATRFTASALVKPGGVIAHIGLGSGDGGLNIRRMTLQEITFIGTYTYTAKDFRETTKAMFDGRMGSLDWTQIRPLSEGLKAFTELRAGQVAVPKILLTPNI